MLSAVMKENTARSNSFNDTGRSAPISRDRRRVLGGIAASCAGLAGTVVGSSNPLSPFPGLNQAALRERQASCGRTKVGLGRSDRGRDQWRGNPRSPAKRRLYLQE